MVLFAHVFFPFIIPLVHGSLMEKRSGPHWAPFLVHGWKKKCCHFIVLTCGNQIHSLINTGLVLHHWAKIESGSKWKIWPQTKALKHNSWRNVSIGAQGTLMGGEQDSVNGVNGRCTVCGVKRPWGKPWLLYKELQKIIKNTYNFYRLFKSYIRVYEWLACLGLI